MVEPTDAEVAELLGQVNAAGASNHWGAASLRTCVREFLDDLAREVRRFPETAARPQWTLFAADHDRSEPVAFIVMVVSSARAVFVAGRGEWEAVRNFGENFLPHDAFEVISEASASFRVTGSLELTRGELDEWLERT
jgi:hypothetical protein